MGFDAEYTTYDSFKSLLAFTEKLIPLKSPIRRIREIKEPDEIDKLRAAADLGSKGFDYVCTLLTEGISEEKIARELEFFWRKKGGEKLAFDPHIAFGAGTAQPHYHSSNRVLKKDEPVLIDIGVVVDHYYSDMTRVVFFGEPKPEIEKIYRIVFEAYSAALELCRPGTKIGDLDHAARGVIEQEGYQDYFPHSLGHGVGLEIHESPTLRSKGEDVERGLEEGMVITIEPGIYLPGSFGVRLEDTIVITQEGYANITNRPLLASPI